MPYIRVKPLPKTSIIQIEEEEIDKVSYDLTDCCQGTYCVCKIGQRKGWLRRRQFLKILLLPAVLFLSAIGCKSNPKLQQSSLALASVSQLKEGFNIFNLERVVVVLEGTTVRAMSLVCSHQECLLKPNDSGLVCPCHGSRFNQLGEVLKGPAERALTHFKLSIKVGSDKLLVHFSQIVSAEWRLQL